MNLIIKKTTSNFLKIITVLWFACDFGSINAQNGGIIPQRPENYEPYIYKYSTKKLKKFTPKHIKKAAVAVEQMDEVIFNGPYKASFTSLSEHQTPEWFKDAKFGIAVNYGIYSVAGYGPKGYGGNYYTDVYLDHIYTKGKDEYYKNHWGEDFEKDDFIPLFTAEALNAEEYIKLFKNAGARYIVQFNMHRSTGMPLWNSEYTFRDAIDMPPYRDLTDEFVKACRKYGLKYGMYLNLEDSYYPLLMPDNTIHVREWTKMDSNPIATNHSFEVTYPFSIETDARKLQGKIPVYDYVDDYLLPISKEFIDKYEPDYVWFDGGWKRPFWYYKSDRIVAYFYNKFHNKKDVLVNSRLGSDAYGLLGDVLVSEGGQVDGGEITDYWEECRPMGKNFAYDWRENDMNVPSSKRLIQMLIKIVANGGNLLLIVTPDGEGKIPEYQINRLNNIGTWLSLYGEAIYNTHKTKWISEESILGNKVYYTQSKDEKYVYANCFELENEELLLVKVRAKEGSEIKLLGYNQPLTWYNVPWGLTIKLPAEFQEIKNKRDSPAWVFRFEPKDGSSRTHQQNE